MAMRAVQQALSGATRLAAGFAGLVILLMMLVGVVDVAGRYLFNAPLASGFELTGLSMVLVVFGGLAACGAAGGHVTINILGGLLDGPHGWWIRGLVHALGAAMLLAIAWRSGEVALDYYASGEVSNMLRAPLYPFVGAVAIGAGLYGLVMALQAVNAVSMRGGDSIRP